MALIKTTTNMILEHFVLLSPPSVRTSLPCFSKNVRLPSNRSIRFDRISCAVSDSGADKKVSSRLSQVQQLLKEAEERASSAGNEPTPKITIDHVTLSFARSGGPGGQNVNKVNTKVDMRFNVNNAYWLSERIRERIVQMEKNRINKDGELVVSSTRTRTQKLVSLSFLVIVMSVFASMLAKELVLIHQYLLGVTLKMLSRSYRAAIGEQKRLKSKKANSEKKAFRRSRDSWD